MSSNSVVNLSLRAEAVSTELGETRRLPAVHRVRSACDAGAWCGATGGADGAFHAVIQLLLRLGSRCRDASRDGVRPWWAAGSRSRKRAVVAGSDAAYEEPCGYCECLVVALSPSRTERRRGTVVAATMTVMTPAIALMRS